MKKFLAIILLCLLSQLSFASGLSVALGVLAGHKTAAIATHTDPDPPCPAGKKCDPSWPASYCPAPVGGAIACATGDVCCPAPLRSQGHTCLAAPEGQTVSDCCTDGHRCMDGKLCQYDTNDNFVGCADPNNLFKK